MSNPIFDYSRPAGTDPVSLGDDTIRDNQEAVQAALDLEHDFSNATQAEQSGRHSFETGDDITLDALVPAPVNGGLAWSTTPHVDSWTLMVYDDGTGPYTAAGGEIGWHPANVAPGDIPRTNFQSQYQTCQFAPAEQVALLPNSPAGFDGVTVDLQASPIKLVTQLNAPLFINNPTNPVAGAGTTVQLIVTMGTLPDLTISFGTQYRSANGVTPDFGTGASDINVFWISYLQDGSWLVTSAPRIAVIP